MHTWNMCMTIKTVVVFQGTPTETTGSMIHAYSKYSAKRIFKDAFHLPCG